MTFTQYTRDHMVIYGWKQNNVWLFGPFSKELK